MGSTFTFVFAVNCFGRRARLLFMAGGEQILASQELIGRRHPWFPFEPQLWPRTAHQPLWGPRSPRKSCRCATVLLLQLLPTQATDRAGRLRLYALTAGRSRISAA